MGFRGRFRHEVLSHPRWRKWFSVRKFLRRHIEMTVIYHIETNTELRRSFRNDSHKSFRRDSYLSYRNESIGCNIKLGTEVSTWLHLRLWKDHHLKLTERILLQPRGQIYGGQSVALRRCAECRWSGSGTIDLISGDFHFAVRRLNPGNNSLREIPIKGGRSHLRLSNFI